MRRRKPILAGLLLLVAAAFTALLMSGREPVCLGHPVSYWIEPWQHHGSEPPERIVAAFAAMDDRAVAWLTRQLRWRPSSARRVFARVMNSVIGDFMSERSEGDRRPQAAEALGQLGQRAASAIPALEQLARGGAPGAEVTDSARGAAIGALILLRHDPVQPCVHQLCFSTNQDWTVWFGALAVVGTNAAPSVPFLVDTISTATNENVKCRAAASLWYIHSQPDLMVPALASLLADTNRDARWHAVRGLARLGPAARPARSALLPCLSDPDRDIRQWTTNTLLNIDSEAAQPGGIR